MIRSCKRIRDKLRFLKIFSVINWIAFIVQFPNFLLPVPAQLKKKISNCDCLERVRKFLSSSGLLDCFAKEDKWAIVW